MKMFETGIRQFQMAMGMVWGRRLDPRNIGRLVDDVLATVAEFGEPGTDAEQLLGQAVAGPEARLELATRSLRRTPEGLPSSHRSMPGDLPRRTSCPPRSTSRGWAPSRSPPSGT
jgi:hypothetical protein